MVKEILSRLSFNIIELIEWFTIMATLRGQKVISKYPDIYNFKSRDELLKVLNNFDWIN